MQFSTIFTAASMATLAMATGLVTMNVTIPDVSSLANLGTFDFHNATAISAFMEENAAKFEELGLAIQSDAYKVSELEPAPGSELAVNAPDQSCAVCCLYTLWWGPIPYAM